MSKRELKKYTKELTKKQLEEQIIELYEKFKEVKEYYDFVFNPQEEKLIEECKTKLLKEYFPTRAKRSKMRRSTITNYVKHFSRLGVEPHLIADIMLYNIEVAQKYKAKYSWVKASFYPNNLKCYQETIQYITANKMKNDFSYRLEKISQLAQEQNWENKLNFADIFDEFKNGN